MRTLDAESISLIIDTIKSLQSRRFEPIEFSIKYDQGPISYYETYTDASAFVTTIESQINFKEVACQIGDYATLESMKVKNSNLDKYLNNFLVYDIQNNLKIREDRILNNFKQTKIQRDVQYYKDLLLSIFGTYKTSVNNIVKLDLTKLYVLPCYVDDGYVSFN